VKGIVYTDAKQVEVTDDLEVRPPGPGEVTIRIAAAGLCHSDVSVIDGTIPFPTPVVLGHEGAGVVEEVGPGVTLVASGDTVVLSTLTNCGRCPACERGRPTQCVQSIGQLSQPFTFRGAPAWSFANTSVFTERTVVKEAQAVKIDPRVPMHVAALIGCGVVTGVGAVLNRAKVQPGDTVAVFGIGGIGLNVVQGARLAGATRIIAVDTNTAKEAVAREFGATHFIDPTAGDVNAAVNELVRGGVSFAFECVGNPAVLRTAIDILGPGGHAVILGVPPAGVEASFVVSSMYLDKGILACRYGTSRPRVDIPMLADLYLAGRLKLDELVTCTYPLPDFQHALDDLAAGKLARGVLTV
jgi:S-(hydroxymethyl)glutathione dehydrogenase/alcohol dehydrogenase